MLPKPATINNNKQKEEQKKSVVVIPNRLADISHDDIDGLEETEIAAEISVSPDGGWGWIVVMSSFYNIFMIDGIYFTFASLLFDMSEDLAIESTLVALINSIAASLVFLMGPLASALINRFGFRVVAMAGSIVVVFAYISTYLCTSYGYILLFYGVFSGFGGSLVAIPSILIVGFYFERRRIVAMSIAGSGSSVGIMIMSKINSILVDMFGWRITVLIHSLLISFIFFTTMTYRPLLSMTVTKTIEGPSSTVTRLPSLSRTQVDRIQATQKADHRAGVTERLFNAVSNANFPTAATVVKEVVAAEHAPGKAGPSKTNISKLTVTAHSPQSGFSRRMLKQVESIRSRPALSGDKDVDITVNITEPERPSTRKRWWARCCPWEDHIPQSRPMYRDDAFYQGKIERLPVYQKSVLEKPEASRTGLEYKLAVSRAVTTADLEERHGICTTACRRILASMLDPKLLQKLSFLLMCSNGFLVYLGIMIPYVFLADRNMSEGIDPSHCSLFVSAIGFANILGRIFTCLMALKFDVLKLYQVSCVLAGVGTMSFNFSFNVYYQYFCCAVFGVFTASFTSLRSVVLVLLFGLDKLTNATGMLLLFQGISCVVSTPLSSIIEKVFNYTIAFYFAGTVIVLGGIVLLPVRRLVDAEKQKEAMSRDVETKNVTYTSNK